MLRSGPVTPSVMPLARLNDLLLNIEKKIVPEYNVVVTKGPW